VGPQQRLLLIDDDPDTSHLFGEALREDGFSVTACVHERLPERDGIAVVITDLNMRGHAYSSDVAREWLGTLRDRYGVPVVVVTGHAEAARDPALASEAAGVLGKPVDLDELRSRIVAAIEVAAQR
jgi:DNA-binding response OmpR family regulator